MKRIIFDVGHPAQVHQFKHLYWELEKDGWQGLFTVKKKEINIDLLNTYNLPYRILGENRKGILNKLIAMPTELFKCYRIFKIFQPDIILSRFSLHSSYISKLLGVPHIGFADTEHTKLFDKLTVPFANVKITSSSYGNDLGRNHIRYPGNIELFYLHPNRFKADESILFDLGLQKNDKFVIVRFVSWQAHHDVGQCGFSFHEKLNLVNALSQYAKVFITSEKQLPHELEPYRVSLQPEKIHDALAFATLYIGEGGTMASEAACLGTPSIYINSLTMGYIEEEARYGLLYNFNNAEEAHKKAIEILSCPDHKKEAQSRLARFLESKIDSISFLIWVIEHYPQSIETLNRDPHFPEKFRIKK